MKQNNAYSVGVEVKKTPPSPEPLTEVVSNRVAFIAPAERGRPPEVAELDSLAAFVAAGDPSLTTSIPSVHGASLDEAEAEPREMAVEMHYGKERPSCVEEDFLERNLIFKAVDRNAPEGASEIERRPLLASRIEETALESILTVIHILGKQGRSDELLDVDNRKALASAIREHARKIENIINKHQRANGGSR